ncbi:MAG: hypothetical protein ACKO23_05570, partial [Gemmataceae bacterium]
MDLGSSPSVPYLDMEAELAKSPQAKPRHPGEEEDVPEEEEEVVITGASEKEEEPAPQAAPVAPVKQKGRAGAFVGGGLLGYLAGAASLAGAWFGGVIPDDVLNMVKPTQAPRPSQPTAPPPMVPPLAPVATAKMTDHLRTGDLEKVEPAMLDQVDDSKLEERLARAEFNWLNYLRTTRGSNPKAALAATAEPVKKALDDLKAVLAGDNADLSADALFLRGQIHEMTGNLKEARADYDQGLKKFAANPAQKLRFETALQVLDLSKKVSHLVPAGVSPRLVALMLIGLQEPGAGTPPPPAKDDKKPADAKTPPPPPAGTTAPPANPSGAGVTPPPAPPAGGTPPSGGAAPTTPPTPPAPPEAGPAFWAALREARAGKYNDALKFLADARARHDQRRYLLPRKPQNPASDPREEIFLSACDLLEQHWQLQARLANPEYLEADASKRDPKVDALLARATERTAARLLQDLTTRLVPKDTAIANADELVKFLDGERKAKDDKVKDLEGMVKTQEKSLTDVNGKLKETSLTLSKTQETLKATEGKAKDLDAAREAALATLKDVGEAVESKFVDVKTSGKPLVQSVREAKQTAKIKDPMGTIRQLEGDLSAVRNRLADRWEPSQLLPVWQRQLDQNRAREELVPAALKDVQRVRADAGSSAEAQAQAMLIEGLVLRNQEKYADATTLLKKCLETLKDPESRQIAETALREASDPAGSYRDRAREMLARNQRGEAVALLEKAIQQLPQGKGPLQAERARIAFDQARSKGSLRADDPLVKNIRQDAGAAAQSGVAEGHYLLGRVSEELGQLAEAERSYREAIRVHDKMDAEGSRYRVALARVLLRQQPGGNEIRPLPSPTRIGQGSSEEQRRTAMEAVSLLLALTLQAPPAIELPRPRGDASEAERLADQVLAQGDKAPFDARAQALAVKGLHTRALNVYVNGLRDKGLIDPEYANNLLALVKDHPAMRRPESLLTPDPLKGEKHYA